MNNHLAWHRWGNQSWNFLVMSRRHGEMIILRWVPVAVGVAWQCFALFFWWHFRVSEPLSSTLTQTGRSHACLTFIEKVRLIWSLLLVRRDCVWQLLMFTEWQHSEQKQARILSSERSIFTEKNWSFHPVLMFVPACKVPRNFIDVQLAVRLFSKQGVTQNTQCATTLCKSNGAKCLKI